MRHREVTLDDKFVQEDGHSLLTGIQALVRLPLDQKRADRRAGFNTAGYVSGYRGSPLGGYDQQMRRQGKLLAEHDVVFQEGLNEDLAATAVWGSQQLGLFPGARYQGVFGLWYGKAPGVDRTGDVFKHANFAGTSALGGVLAVAGDDHMCKSSTLPSQSEFAYIDAEIPVLSPASIQDVLDYGMHGWAMSRYSGLWTGLIALADTMDSAGVVNIDPARLSFAPLDASFLPEVGVSIRRGDEPMAKELRLRQFKLPAARAYVRANRLDRVVLHSKRPKLGIVATGQAARDVFEALDALGISHEEAGDLGLTVYKVAMPWPLEPQGLKEFATGLQTLMVVEHKRALMEPQIRDALYDMESRPRVIGKHDEDGEPLFPIVGSIPIPMLARILFERLPDGPHAERAQAWLDRVGASSNRASTLESDAHRKPHFCSGCPHNTSTVVPEDSRALAGIGCHYMATFMPDRMTDMTSQMGGEGVGWLGQAPFTDEGHVFVNLGDGTYAHSGSLAIRAAVAGGATLTYKLLYNDAVAMTGGQPTETGQTVPQIARQLLGEGVARVVVVADDPTRYSTPGSLDAGVDVFHRSRLDEVQRTLRDTKGVTVLIYDQVCATEKRRRIKRGLMAATTKRAFINSDVCEGCGDCSKQSNCLSIAPLETELGVKRQIDQSSCNQDLRCVDGFCPSFVTIEGSHNAKKDHTRPSFDATLLPMPEIMDLSQTRNLVFTGVGGTGVTTVAAIVGMAAHVDGKGATTLDMTGLAQKGGPVVSHVRIAKEPGAIHGARTPPGSADALIAGDLIVATGLDALGLLCSSNTQAVANADVTPTSEFVFDRTKRFDGRRLTRKLNGAVNTLYTVNAEALAEEYLFDALYSNMITLGFAWQKGLVPITLRGLYRAIKLNGAAVEANMLAFDLGRIAAHDPGRLKALVPPRTPPTERPLDDLIAHRSTMLLAWGNEAWAAEYRSFVAQVRARENALGLGEGLTRAVAQNLAKLMTYKDEYEVARLYSDPSYKARLSEQFAGPMKLKVWLSPPLLAPKDKRTGIPKKIAFGGWIFPVFSMLQHFKFLRGTPFDIMGMTAERAMERALIGEYRATVDRLLLKLNARNHGHAIEIAQFPDSIRGFGHVKEASLVATKSAVTEKLAAYDAT